MNPNRVIPRLTSLTFLLLGISFGSLFAQTGTIQGAVTNQQNSSPLPGINITLQGTHYGTATDQDGTYIIRHIPADSYTLVVSGIGFEKEFRNIDIEANENLTLDFSLEASTEELSEVTVTGHGEGNYNSTDISPSLKVATPLLETPQNIQVVTGQLLDDQQVFNMVEGVSRNISGVHRTEHWDNMYARINMRGSKIPAFRNGMNVEMPWGPLSEDMSMVEHIEFVKGPAGFMMANGEPGGFYNVVTKKPTDESGTAATFSTGSFNTLRATADFGGKVTKDNSLLYRLNLMGQQKNTHRDFGYNNRYAVAPVLKYSFNEQTSLTAEYTYQYSEFHQPGGYVASPDGYTTLPRDFSASDPKIGPSKINDHSLFLTFNHQLNSQWSVTAKMAYFNYNVFAQYVYPGAIDEEGNMSRNLSIWDAQATNKLGQIYLNGVLSTGAVDHRILGGLDLSDKQYIAVFPSLEGLPDLNIYNPQYDIPADSIPEYNPPEPLNKRATYRDNISQTAVYLQDELHFWDDKVRLTLAGRLTDSNTNDVKEQVFTPRAGISISPYSNSSIYALYDQAYLPQGGSDFEGNPFDPVRGHNIEAGLKRQWFNGDWSSTISVYRIRKENVLTADPNHPDFSVQLGEIQTQGVEVDIKGRLLRGLNLVLNYAYTDSKVTEDTDEAIVGEPTPGTARHINNAWLTYRLPDDVLEGLGISLGYQWQIDRTSWYSFDGLEKPLEDYFRLDGGISWENDRLNIALNVNNILDEYLYSGFPPSTADGSYVWITEPPRNFRLSVGYKF